MDVIVRPAAATDIEEAYVWYERQRPGLGEKFLTGVQAIRDGIAAHPEMYPVIHRETRRVLLHRFPCGIFYRVYADAIVVIACMHAKRDPARWKSRG
jgi:plasmid stabilization system protein ParE